MMKRLLLLTLVVLLFHSIVWSQTNTLIEENGKVEFMSQAPLELIKATSVKLKGAIDIVKNTFAFSVDINSFKGFNGDLQREHFHENYMQTEKFPTASFSGKIIEQIDFSVNGTYEVRAKGIFVIHGISKERIVKGIVTLNNELIGIKAGFTLRLEEHDIKVPRIVYEKIAEEIIINIDFKFKKAK